MTLQSTTSEMLAPLTMPVEKMPAARARTSTMRICHILEAAGGGSGQVVIDLVKSNVESGMDVSLIYSPNRTDQRFKQALEALNGRLNLYAIPMQRSVGLHDIVSCWRLFQLLRRLGRFDVVHSHSSKAGALARIAGLFLPQSIQIYTPHAFLTMSPNASPVFGWIEWLLCWLGSAIICVSPQEKRHAAETLKIPPRKLHVIVNGVPLDFPATRSHARATMGFHGDDFVVGFVGRLVEQKNPFRMIDAFAAAAQERPELRLAIVGDGPLEARMKAELAERNLMERVRFMGASNGKELMPGFDCLLCSSDYEAFGLVILEAMAAGVPVISTPVGIAEEAVISGRAGFVTDDFSHLKLAEAVVRLASMNLEKRADMSTDTKRMAQDFSLEGMAGKTMNLYASLVAQQRA